MSPVLSIAVVESVEKWCLCRSGRCRIGGRVVYSSADAWWRAVDEDRGITRRGQGGHSGVERIHELSTHSCPACGMSTGDVVGLVRSAAGLLFDPVDELGDLVEDAAPFGHEITDLAVGVHDRGVVTAAELLADLGERQIGELTAEVHGDLTRLHEVSAAVGSADLLDAVLGVRRGLGDDERGRDFGFAAFGDEVLEDDLCQSEVDLLAIEAREGGRSDERTLEFADVGLDLARDELQNVRRRGELLRCGLLAEDRDPGLEIGRLDVGDEPPLEAVAEPVLECLEPFGRAVGADDDLLVRVVQGVESVEELLLGLDLALEELDVVDEEYVDVAVTTLERRGAIVADGVDEVVGEFFATDVPDA